MISKTTDCDVAIIGAGSAGLSVARRLRERQVSFVLIEAAHRIGGRAYSEQIEPGVNFDLGCHWLHSASINPYRQIADELGFNYSRETYPKAIFRDGTWLNTEERAGFDQYYTQCVARFKARDGDDCALADAIDRESRWAPLFDYYASLDTSGDTDESSCVDWCNYEETEENWPVREGLGALVAQYFADIPVSLNAAVNEVHWQDGKVLLVTQRGVITAKKAVLCVSTGVLASDEIDFNPALPEWKLAAIDALPLGVHNRIALRIAPDALSDDVPSGVTVINVDDTPMNLRIRPFGANYVVGVTGGRFAQWLERVGTEASAKVVTDHLVSLFGSNIRRQIRGHLVTAWGGDPWTRGSYSFARPGQSQMRTVLGNSIDERLYFAGEAASETAHSTVHGALLSGQVVADEIAQALA